MISNFNSNYTVLVLQRLAYQTVILEIRVRFPACTQIFRHGGKLSSEYEETVQGFCHRGSILSNCFLELKLKLLKGIWLIGKGACLQNKIEQVRFLHSPQRRSRFFALTLSLTLKSIVQCK